MNDDAFDGVGRLPCLRAELLVLRHGSTGWSAARRFTGQTDVPLDAAGHAQADEAEAVLSALRPRAIVSSDLRRAVQTADYLARRSSLSVVTNPALREEFLGPWEGCTIEEVSQRFPDALARWRAGTVEAHDGREGLLAVGRRAAPVVVEALATSSDPSRPIVVVTHSNTTIALAGTLLGLPPACWLSIGGLSPGAWSAFERDDMGRWALKAHNVRR